MDNHIPRRVLRPYVVFISHSDEELAYRTKIEIENSAKSNLPRILAPLGVKAIVAERTETPGEDLRVKLGKMIQVSSVVVALLTKSATESEWVRWEMKKAQELDKKIIPFVEKGEYTIAVGLPKTIEWHPLDKNDLLHIAEHVVKEIKQGIPGLHWLKGWRPGVIIKNKLEISDWLEYTPGMTLEKIRELRTKRKAENDAWYWLQQHGIDP